MTAVCSISKTGLTHLDAFRLAVWPRRASVRQANYFIIFSASFFPLFTISYTLRNFVQSLADHFCSSLVRVVASNACEGFYSYSFIAAFPVVVWFLSRASLSKDSNKLTIRKDKKKKLSLYKKHIDGSRGGGDVVVGRWVSKKRKGGDIVQLVLSLWVRLFGSVTWWRWAVQRNMCPNESMCVNPNRR